MVEHERIARTAAFLRDTERRAGAATAAQAQVVLQLKQAANAQYGFLEPAHALHSYFAFLKRTGAVHVPPNPPPPPPPPLPRAAQAAVAVAVAGSTSKAQASSALGLVAAYDSGTHHTTLR